MLHQQFDLFSGSRGDYPDDRRKWISIPSSGWLSIVVHQLVHQNGHQFIDGRSPSASSLLPLFGCDPWSIDQFFRQYLPRIHADQTVLHFHRINHLQYSSVSISTVHPQQHHVNRLDHLIIDRSRCCSRITEFVDSIISHWSPSLCHFIVVFLRLYLLCRLLMFYSYLYANGSSQCLGSLNRVPINVFFLFKTYLEQHPARCLSIFVTLMFCIGSWSLRVCNYRSAAEHLTLFDSMWLFIVTFTTVGQFPPHAK